MRAGGDARPSTMRPMARILVVDDEPDILDLVRLSLAEAGFAVETAATAQEAIRPMPFRIARPPRMRDILAEALKPLISRRQEGG